MTRVKSLLLLIVVLALAAPVAYAQNTGLSAAQQAGQVGERPDGLIGAVSGSPAPAIRRLVDQVNNQRLAEYRKIAADTGAPLDAVQARAGAQLTARVPRGQYIMDASERWRQK